MRKKLNLKYLYFLFETLRTEVANRSLHRINVRDDATQEDEKKQKIIDYIFSADASFYLDPAFETGIKKSSPFDKFFDEMIEKEFRPLLAKQDENQKNCKIFVIAVVVD